MTCKRPRFRRGSALGRYSGLSVSKLFLGAAASSTYGLLSVSTARNLASKPAARDFNPGRRGTVALFFRAEEKAGLGPRPPDRLEPYPGRRLE